jgi:hypothetical protein
MRCAGELYVSGSVEEYADPEWSYVVRAQCNAGPGGNCGFDLVVDEVVDLDGKAWGITNKDMVVLQRRHIHHSRGKR